MRARFGLLGCLCALGLACDGPVTVDRIGSGGKADRGEDTELLSPQEAQNVADAFDGICGDTFCCGDLNYYMASVSCDGATGVCDLRYDAQPYYEEDKFAADALEGFPPEALMREGGTGDRAYVGRVLEAITDEDGVWIRVSCQLDGGYLAYADLMDGDSGHCDDLGDRIYDHFLDCLHAMEDVLYKTIPAGPPTDDSADL